jgi:hypothetical protein
MLHRPKAVASITAQSWTSPLFGGRGGNSRDIEAVIGFRRSLVLDVVDPHVVRHVAAAHHPVAPSPQMLAPVTLAQQAELTQQPVRAAALQVLHSARHRQARGIDKHVDMVAIDRPCMHHHLVRPRSLAQRFAAASPNVAAKHWVTILRHPDQVILAVPNRVAANGILDNDIGRFRRRGDLLLQGAREMATLIVGKAIPG